MILTQAHTIYHWTTIPTSCIILLYVCTVQEGCKFSLNIVTCNRFTGVPGKPKVNYDQL